MFYVNKRLKTSNLSTSKIRIIQTLGILVFIIFSLVIMDSLPTAVIFATIVGSISFLIRDTASDIISTIILNLYPQYKTGDTLQVSNYSKVYPDLKFDQPGLLRTPFINSDGSYTYIPNRILLNNIVKVN